MDNLEQVNDTNDDTLDIQEIMSELPKLVQNWLYQWFCKKSFRDSSK